MIAVDVPVASPTSQIAWCVCLTKPRQEALAASKLQEQGYEVYLPILARWVRRARGWCQQPVVMFPRYCFVRPRREDQAIGPIRSTPGVTTLVRFGTIIATLHADKLDVLRQLLDAQAAASPGQPFELGSSVVFDSGPLKGAGGIVSDIADERVTVLMSLLGRDQSVTTTAASLACAEAAG